MTNSTTTALSSASQLHDLASEAIYRATGLARALRTLIEDHPHLTEQREAETTALFAVAESLVEKLEMADRLHQLEWTEVWAQRPAPAPAGAVG